MEDMNDSVSWAQGSKCYEQLKVVDNMNNSRSHELKLLDFKNDSLFWKIWMILGHEHQALNVMNT